MCKYYSDHIELYTRNMKRLPDREEYIYKQLFVIPEIEFCIDCELVTDNQSTSSSVMRINEKVKLIAFDVISYKFEKDKVVVDTTKKPIIDRRAILSDIFDRVPGLFSIVESVHLKTPTITESNCELLEIPDSLKPIKINDLIKYFVKLCHATQLEGVVYKIGSSAYEYGKSSQWKKFKCDRDTIDVIILSESKGKKGTKYEN